MSQGLQSSADTATRRPTAPGRGSSSRQAGSAPNRNGTVIWTLIALALVAGVLYAQRADSNDSAVGWSLAGGISSGPVKISGYARGLYPGVSGYLLTKVRNGSAHAVAITRIWVRAGRGAPGCPSKTLRIGRYRGRRLVGSGRTWRLAIPIMIRAGSADACQGARYPLLFLFRQARR